MVVAARPVSVPMCQLIFRGTTYFRNFDIERQIHPRQGMIPIQRDVRLGHFRRGDDGRMGILPARNRSPTLMPFAGIFSSGTSMTFPASCSP